MSSRQIEYKNYYDLLVCQKHEEAELLVKKNELKRGLSVPLLKRAIETRTVEPILSLTKQKLPYNKGDVIYELLLELAVKTDNLELLKTVGQYISLERRDVHRQIEKWALPEKKIRSILYCYTLLKYDEAREMKIQLLHSTSSLKPELLVLWVAIGIADDIDLERYAHVQISKQEQEKYLLDNELQDLKKLMINHISQRDGEKQILDYSLLETISLN